jgi:hypothetical protein
MLRNLIVSVALAGFAATSANAAHESHWIFPSKGSSDALVESSKGPAGRPAESKTDNSTYRSAWIFPRFEQQSLGSPISHEQRE